MLTDGTLAWVTGTVEMLTDGTLAWVTGTASLNGCSGLKSIEMVRLVNLDEVGVLVCEYQQYLYTCI